MRRELYKRWHNHPLREILKRAQDGDHIYPDELDDLRLPPKVRRATEKAIAEVAKPGAKERGSIFGGLADDLSSVLVDSLPAHHETSEDFLKRRRSMGDPEATATLKAQRQAEEDQAAEIQRNSMARGNLPGRGTR